MAAKRNIIEVLRKHPEYVDIAEMINNRLIHNNLTINDYPENEPPCFDGISDKYQHLLTKFYEVQAKWLQGSI